MTADPLDMALSTPLGDAVAKLVVAAGRDQPTVLTPADAALLCAYLDRLRPLADMLNGAPGRRNEPARGDQRDDVAARVDAAERDRLGRYVRGAWESWAQEQPDADTHPSWLVPYDQLPERDREADRRIGAALRAVVSTDTSRRIAAAIEAAASTARSEVSRLAYGDAARIARDTR